MSVEKKKVKPKPIKKAPANFKVKKIKIDSESIKFDSKKFVRVKCGSAENFKGIGERVQAGELIWSHYAMENDIGVHYYSIIKK